jgi:hypothetical protein
LLTEPLIGMTGNQTWNMLSNVFLIICAQHPSFPWAAVAPKASTSSLRSRECYFSLFADISAFYHRINVLSKHQSLHQRFIFREFGSNKSLQTYKMTTLVFGAVHASKAAIWTLQHAVKGPIWFFSELLADRRSL